MTEEKIDFTLPAAIRDFVFDLHDAMRRSRRQEEVHQLYDVKFKEITEKYFAQSAWPLPAAISKDVGNDENFLLFYRCVL